MRLGFVGTGTITAHIVRGLKTSPLADRGILLSPRNAATAQALATLPGVTVAADNQAVVDGADLVVLAVRPQVAEAVLSALTIPADKLVISLIAGLPIARVQALTGATQVARAIPLPFTEARRDAVPVHPPHPWAMEVFAALGQALPVEKVEEFDIYAATSALMGSYFGLAETALGWAVTNGLPPAQARAYLARLFANLGQVLADNPASPEALRHDHSTRGGLNEQVWRLFAQSEGPQALTAGLDAVLARIRGA